MLWSSGETVTKFRMLDRCLDYINRSGESSSIGVTLVMGGALISGNLIHPMAYFKSIIATLPDRSEPSNEDIKRLKPSEITLENTREIFLKNVRVLSSPHQTVIDQPIAMSIDSIDGFIFGNLNLSLIYHNKGH